MSSQFEGTRFSEVPQSKVPWLSCADITSEESTSRCRQTADAWIGGAHASLDAKRRDTAEQGSMTKPTTVLVKNNTFKYTLKKESSLQLDIINSAIEGETVGGDLVHILEERRPLQVLQRGNKIRKVKSRFLLPSRLFPKRHNTWTSKRSGDTPYCMCIPVLEVSQQRPKLAQMPEEGYFRAPEYVGCHLQL
ncbi:hypothetical protein SKAU_G00004070 [Synaphobranchus kaupii]|uniref:Uncharacterized protein n=1 Tax=Synaphobranchus kaupii TaxID=118154 RepID=A0A9Q1G9Y6_SYNKA|nr:hypothetical protein SKAU_G00004070 [Synaphobranchus kaupii]